jgi:hypothetical protein
MPGNDVATDLGLDFFVALVDAAEVMRGLWQRCSAHAALLRDEVVLSANLRNYSGKRTFEICVDSESRTGKAYAWCVEIRRTARHWSLERAVRLNDGDGQRTLLELGPLEFESTEALARQLPDLTRELVETFSRVEIT